MVSMIGLDKLHLTPALLRLYAQIDEFKGYWNGLDDYTTGLNLLGDVAAHGEQLKTMLTPLQSKDLSVDIICVLHKAFNGQDDLAGQLKNSNSPIEFTKDGNLIAALDTAMPEDVRPLLSKLIDWVNEALLDDDYHPLLIIAVFIAIFLQISPFSTANVKLAKFLIVLLLLKAGYRYAPFATLDEAFDQHLEDICHSLQEQQQSLENGQPKWDTWLYSFAVILNHHASTLQSQINGEENKSQAVASMPSLSIQLLEVIRQHKRATMKLLIAETNGRRSTIKLRMQELVEQEIVKRYGAGRGVWYSLV